MKKEEVFFMTTKTLNKQVHDLSQEVLLLRSFVISIIGERDPEGEYRPEFVKKILHLAKKKQPNIKFTTSEDLLEQIR